MAMPIAPGTPPLGPDGANLLLGIRGTWKGRPPLAPGPIKGLNQMREWMDARIAEVMHVVDSGGGANVQIQLKADFHAAYKALVPPDIQFALDAALVEAQAAGPEPPLLRVYVHPHLEWIPWELLHDGTDHLGVRFMIARLPVL